jgi:HEPN domain-containing protein/predicted nucleotidyltransferase
MVTLEEAKEAAQSIVKALDPRSVIVFGSVARDGIGADLDLLIITDDSPETLKKDHDRLLNECLRRFYERFDIDPFIVPKSLLREHYAEGSPFLRLIMREGRVLYMKDIVADWLQQAEEDSRAAKYLFDGGYFRSACYSAQQAIEKAIKAWLLKEGWELEKVHSIRRLLSIGRRFELGLDVSDDETTFIDSVYRGRYPAEAGLLPLGEPSRTDAEKAVALAGRILKAVQAGLKNR